MADIFDKMLDGINKGVNSVAAGSKTVIEKAKINSAISNLEHEKKELSAFIGEKVYSLYKEGKLQDTEEFGSLCEQIDQKNNAIAVKRQELAKLEAPAPAAPAQAGVVYCSQCGSQNAAASKFCAKCGSQMQ